MREIENTTREILSHKYTTLDGVYDEAHLIQKHCMDYTLESVNNLTMRLLPDGNIRFLTDKGILSLAPSSLALSQLCNKIGVPYRYLTKCINSGRIDLATDNISSWLIDYNKDLFVRTYKNTIRGILTPRYSVCDSPDILEVVSSVLTKDLILSGYYVSEERLHLRLRESEPLNIKGEDLYAGLQIDSSDVGRNILSVKFLLFKLVCTNGLVLPKGSGVLFEQRHLGITPQDFHDGLVVGIKKFDDVKEYAEEVIKGNIASDTISSLLREGTPDDLIQYIISRVKVSEVEAEDICKLFNTRVDDGRYSFSNWGLINTITEYAQRYTLEKRIQLENSAGSLLVA